MKWLSDSVCERARASAISSMPCRTIAARQGATVRRAERAPARRSSRRPTTPRRAPSRVECCGGTWVSRAADYMIAASIQKCSADRLDAGAFEQRRAARRSTSRYSPPPAPIARRKSRAARDGRGRCRRTRSWRCGARRACGGCHRRWNVSGRATSPSIASVHAVELLGRRRIDGQPWTKNRSFLVSNVPQRF